MQKTPFVFGIKVVLLVPTFTGQAIMWMVVFTDMGASPLVGLACIFGQAQFVWLTSRSA